MAAELAKVSLWLEALEPGKPLSYLDQNIRVGNSLLGVTPALLAEGLPDAAFTPIEGDDRKVAAALKKQNAERAPGPARPVQPSPASPSPTPSWPSEPSRSPAHCPTAWKTCTSTSSARPWNSPNHPNSASRSSSPTPGAPRSSSPRPPSPAPPRSPRRSWNSSARTPGTLELAAAEDLVIRPHPPVPLLPLARRVPPHLPRRQRRHRHRPGHRLGRRLLLRHRQPALGASQAPGTGVLRRPQPRDRQRRRTRPRARRLIAALADSDSPADRTLSRRVRRPSCARQQAGATCSASPAATHLPAAGDINTYAVFAETARTIIEATWPHGLVSCRRESPPTQPPHRSSGDLVRNAQLVRSSTSRIEAFLTQSGIVDHSVLLLLADGLGPASASKPGKLRIRYSLHAGPSATRSSFTMLRQEIFCWSTRTPAPARCSGPGAMPRLRSASTSASPSSGATNRKRTRGVCRSCECSTWPTTQACSGPVMQLERDGWTLAGNIFVRDGKRMLPLYEAKMIHHFDHRLGCYSKATEAQPGHRLPRLDLEREERPGSSVIPATGFRISTPSMSRSPSRTSRSMITA